jgi:hypothetical protein
LLRDIMALHRTYDTCTDREEGREGVGSHVFLSRALFHDATIIK